MQAQEYQQLQVLCPVPSSKGWVKESLWEASVLPGTILSQEDAKELIPESVSTAGCQLHSSRAKVKESFVSDLPVFKGNKKPVLPLDMTPEFDCKAFKHTTQKLNKVWPPQIVLSISGGKDSTALLLKMVEEGFPIHSAVFVDLGWEFPQIYDHLAKLESYTGIKITRVSSKHNLDDLLVKYRWPTMGRRWCTSEKTAAVKRYFRSLSSDYLYYDTIGFSFDERARSLKKGVQKKASWFPLIDRL